jgi:hypothetical protein
LDKADTTSMAVEYGISFVPLTPWVDVVGYTKFDLVNKEELVATNLAHARS